MTLKKKQRHKPFYKQFIKLRQNIQNRIKILKFKKQKWNKLQKYSLKQLKFFKRYKIKDQFSLTPIKFASRGNSYQKRFRNNLRNKKIFNLFYGGLKEKYLKNQINSIKKKKNTKLKFQNYQQNTIKFFESRLDTILYRSKFSFSIKNARQLILHGHVLINNNIVKTSSYIVKTNDLIEISKNSKSRLLILKNIDRSNFWPIPPSYLQINYNTLQIIIGLSQSSTFLPLFSHSLKINSLISNINR